MNRRLISVVLLLASTGARGTELSCPPTLKVHESLVSSRGDWSEGRSKEPHRLAGVTIFDGPPSQMASVIGAENVLSRTQTRTTWSLDPNREYWLLCSYANTGVTLFRAIPRTAKACVVTYSSISSIAGLPEILKLQCR
jgi:hypothetical protein